MYYNQPPKISVKPPAIIGANYQSNYNYPTSPNTKYFNGKQSDASNALPSAPTDRSDNEQKNFLPPSGNTPEYAKNTAKVTPTPQNYRDNNVYNPSSVRFHESREDAALEAARAADRPGPWLRKVGMGTSLILLVFLYIMQPKIKGFLRSVCTNNGYFVIG